MNDEDDPYLNANQCSKFFFGWITNLFRKQHKQGTIELNDLYKIRLNLKSSNIIDKLELNWFILNKKSLFQATRKTIQWKFLFLGFLLLLKEILNIIQPLLLIYLMDYFQPCSQMSSIEASIYALSTIIVSFLSSLIFNQAYYYLLKLSLEMRIAYQGLVFRKILRLSSFQLNEISSGKLTNHLSNDSSQIEMALLFFHHLWLSPIEIIIIVYFFWYYIKYLSLIPIGYTFLLLIIQILFSKIFLHYQNQILKITDERIKLMSEIIKSIRIIKMYSWELPMEKQIRQIRKCEIIQYGYRLIFECIQLIFQQTYIVLTFYMIYSLMYLLNIEFNSKFFALLSCLVSYMRTPIVEFFSIAIKSFVNYIAAQKRIQEFLLLDESKFNKEIFLSSNSNNILPSIYCNLKSAQWNKDSSFVLDNIVFNGYPGDLICIVGSIGSGKSSLLQTLIGEINFYDGDIQLNGSYCYVPQESWIYSSTIKNNILFGKDFNENLFENVIQSTALDLDFNQFPNRDETVVGDQGAMLSGGQKARINLARALYSNADIYLLDDPLSAVDTKVAKHLFEKTIKGFLKNKICVLVTHQIQFLENATKIILLYNGELAGIGNYNELINNCFLFQNLVNNINQNENKEEEEEVFIINNDDENEEILEINPDETTNEKKVQGQLKFHIYIEYIKSGFGLFFGLIFLLFICIIHQGTFVYSNYWLSLWNDDENYRQQNLTNCSIIQKHDEIISMNNSQWINYRNQKFYIYSGIVGLFVLISIFRTIFIQYMFLNASRVLHNKMFQQLIQTSIEFFDKNPIGRILNRFTKDISIIDDSLPTNAFDFLDCCFQVFGIIGLVGFLQPWSIIPALISTICLIFVRYYFASTSRDLKRIEGITRSPIYSHLSSTIQGLKIIRSSNNKMNWLKQFEDYLNDNIKTNYFIIVTNRWAAIRFDWIALIFITFVTLFAMILRITNYHYFSPTQIALILSYSLSLMALLQWTIRQSVVIETQMTSVERILEYCSLEKEEEENINENEILPLNWPSNGEIIFTNVSMKYSKSNFSSIILKNLSLKIESGEKIGIVGRTGSGKSSLIEILFRMGYICNGNIFIDNININQINLNQLRNRLSIIPQDPILFKGTIRSNLDPLNIYLDEQLWNVLEQVQLKNFILENMSNGLQSIINENGSNLSVGQKQLICLARVILKRTKIILIDEATANVDHMTDELIQKIIREIFQQSTVLTVAHRLRTIIDNQRILVLHHGKLVEFDTPKNLLSNTNSYFNSLVEQTGPIESKYLRDLIFSK